MLADFANKSTCLCSRHQNFALKLRALHNLGFECTQNPDLFEKVQDENTIRELFANPSTDTIKYSEWVKVQEENKYRYKLIQKEEKVQVFEKMFLETFHDFSAHVKRVQHQFKEMKSLRSELPDGQVLVWMDFAENFVCTSVEQPQNAYWNASSVTLHTMVVYIPGKLKPQSIVAVSNELSHAAPTVYAIIKHLIPLVKELYEDLKHVHYLTDSPTSQYRNKSIFQIMTYHQDELDISCQWNYLEAGHGKGPCDGLGASVKRAANSAVCQGKAIIQGAEDFYAWTQSVCNSTVKYFFVSKEDVLACQQVLSSRSKGLKRIVGTMSLHAVYPISKSTIYTRDLSCYCETCKVRPTLECGWKNQVLHQIEDLLPAELFVADHQVDNGIMRPNADSPAAINITEPELTLRVGLYVAAVHDRDWYIGKILSVSNDDVHIDFLEKVGRKDELSFKPPRVKDTVWVKNENIMLNIQVHPTGRSQRMFKLPVEEYELAQKCYSDWCKKH